MPLKQCIILVKKKAGKVGEMTLKFDMSKAYNRVEWVCLDKIMEKLGFNLRSRGLMMQCISFVIYFVRINGKPWGCISPSRGLHQGDHFSPYLFLICVEGLFALIKQSVHDGSMGEVSICRDGTSLSQIFFFFIDDSLIFCKATLEECESLQRVLHVYEEAFGQHLNRAKTSLFFKSNTVRQFQEKIKSRFGA